MKVLIFVVSILSSGLILSDDSVLSRSGHVKAFNEAQSCFNSVANTRGVIKIDCAKRALEEGRFIFEPGSLNIAALTYNYGKALRQRDYKKSYHILGESLELYEVIYGKSSLELINILIDMGEWRKVKDIAKKHFEKDSVEYADVLLKLAMSNMLSSKDTRRHADLALEIYLEEEGIESINSATASFQVGKVRFAQQKYKSAIPYLMGATKHPEVATYAHGWLVRAYGLTDQDELASYHAEQLGRSREGVEGNYVPVFIPSPDYPRRAQRLGVEGYAVVELTISQQGHATRIELVEEWPESYDFGEEALQAAERLLYAPRFIDGVAQEVTGVLYKYQFKMAR